MMNSMRFCVAMAMAAMSASARSTVWSPRSWRDQRISNLMSGYRKFSPESFPSPLKARQSIALFKPF
jgi:hypothetical protein